MALDEAVAVNVRKGDSPPVLRLYGWNVPSVSIGAFQKTDCLNIEYCINTAIPIVRRITGGRAILHGDEITYSFSSGLDGIFTGGLIDVYRKIGGAFNLCFHMTGLICQIKSSHERGAHPARNPLCFQSASVGEISYDGTKLLGSAQKRWKDGFLQQGTIPFSIDRHMLNEVFKLQRGTLDLCSQWGLRSLLPDLDITKFRDCLVSSFEETFRVKLVSSRPSAQELQLADQLASKYLDPAWTLGVKADTQPGNKK
jgi:lipoate-protein ligase A